MSSSTSTTVPFTSAAQRRREPRVAGWAAYMLLVLMSPFVLPAFAQSARDAFNPDANDVVQSLAVQSDGKVLVGGEFTRIGGWPRNRIARLNAGGTSDPGFNPGADGAVYSLAVQLDGKVLVGGAFAQIGGQARDRIARLNEDGTLAAPASPRTILHYSADGTTGRPFGATFCALPF